MNMKRKGGYYFEANESLLENPHGFSVSLVFDGLFVGIFAGCISVIYRLLLNNAEKAIIYDHCIY